MIECDAGVHHVSDVYCVCCGGYMGWQYVDAEDADQKYKIGNFPHIQCCVVSLCGLRQVNICVCLTVLVQGNLCLRWLN